MNLKFASWNVRGLEMKDRKKVVIGWCNKNIICRQEVKVIGCNVFNVLNFIWNQAKSYYDHGHGRGGVAILVDPRWTGIGCIGSP